MAAHVRWKSARFIPLEMVQSILAGERLDERHWSVDGPSGCLVPAGKQGPFRTSVRWSAAVDRLSGATERHSMACIEFRPGAGLWTVIGFADEAARDRWQDAVKAAFRLLADTGFGGERSRGWGRSETPEFIEGELPGMIIGEAPVEGAAPKVTVAEVKAPPVLEPLETPSAEPPSAEPPLQEVKAAEAEGMKLHPSEPVDTSIVEPEPVGQEAVVEEEVKSAEAEGMKLHPMEPVDTSILEPEPAEVKAAEAEGMTLHPIEAVDVTEVATVVEPEAAPVSKGRGAGQAHWLLSLFAPSSADSVDWARGNYTVMARGGRIESPAGSGELKKQVQMIAEGSVVVAESAPRGAAPDVAPDGFAHPVFRAGFALAIPLPEGN
jgi:CRISPR/Cas system CSM-associated protein Csm4 (group 5 of RAMP superfamily)